MERADASETIRSTVGLSGPNHERGFRSQDDGTRGPWTAQDPQTGSALARARNVLQLEWRQTTRQRICTVAVKGMYPATS